MRIRRFWDQHLGCRLDKPSKGADLGGNTGDLHIHISITEDVGKFLILFLIFVIVQLRCWWRSAKISKVEDVEQV